MRKSSIFVSSLQRKIKTRSLGTWCRMVMLKIRILLTPISMYDNDLNTPLVSNTSNDFILFSAARMLLNECLIQCISGSTRRLLWLKWSSFNIWYPSKVFSRKFDMLLCDNDKVTRQQLNAHNSGADCSLLKSKLSWDTWRRSQNAPSSICSKPIHGSVRCYNKTWNREPASIYSSSQFTMFSFLLCICIHHYCDVTMSPTACQITSLTIVYSIVYSGTDQRKHQSSESLAFVRGIHRRPVNSPHKWPVTRKMFPFDDVIMCSSSIIEQYRSKASWSIHIVTQFHDYDNPLYTFVCHKLLLFSSIANAYNAEQISSLVMNQLCKKPRHW